MCRLLAVSTKNKEDLTSKISSILSLYGKTNNDGIGVAWLKEKNHIAVMKSPEEAVDFFTNNHITVTSNTCIGHVRYATHGENNIENTHPLIGKDFVLAHNGVLYNYENLKAELTKKGISFKGDTDSEILVKLIELYGPSNIYKKLGEYDITGNANILVLYEDGTLYAISDGTLCISKNDNGLIITSTSDYLVKSTDIPQNTCLKIKDGVIIERCKLKRKCTQNTSAKKERKNKNRWGSYTDHYISTYERCNFAVTKKLNKQHVVDTIESEEDTNTKIEDEKDAEIKKHYINQTLLNFSQEDWWAFAKKLSEKGILPKFLICSEVESLISTMNLNELCYIEQIMSTIQKSPTSIVS